MYLLDTNVVSELRSPRPHGGVLTWMSGVDPEHIFLSAVTIGELQAGVERPRPQEPARAAVIEDWIDSLTDSYRVLAMDAPAFRLWAKLMVGQSSDLIADAMIAATALTHALTVVTRNIRDFERLGQIVINPFSSSPRDSG